MGFHTGAYATVWEITETGSKFSKIRISTSRKDKESDEYVTDFNGFVSMVGDANKNIILISDALEGGGRCRIKIGSCDVSNRYDRRTLVGRRVFFRHVRLRDGRWLQGQRQVSWKAC